MRAATFLDILTQTIREDLRDEVRAEIQAEVQSRFRSQNHGETPRVKPSAKDVESWLLTHTEKTVFNRPQDALRKAYGSTARKPASPPPPPPRVRERTASAKTTEEIFAFEFLLRFADDKDVDPSAFTESELKALWRQAAMNTHPDRQPQNNSQMHGQIFAEIAEAYHSLRALFQD